MFIIILFFVYGLAFGSFANVVIYRLQKNESIIKTGSHCPNCKKEIKTRDNIPILGFVLLKGKCRYCKKKISVQYPLVELFTGIIFGLIGYFYILGTIDNLLSAVLYSFIFACLIVVFIYDLKFMEIPMNAMWLAIALAVIVNVIIDMNANAFADNFLHSKTFVHSLSALVAFCFFFGLSYVSDETWMGYGDAFVAIIIGLILGPIATFLALMAAFCIGSIVGVGLVLINGKTMKTAIPFGPFLIFGLFIIFIVQNLYPEFMNLFI
ncbi:MAG: prepilin peptidase [Candidatus Moraniibacteriota bacterium]|jgi:leader peptidase (prepilin peptidase) / N-methyltransferase